MNPNLQRLQPYPFQRLQRLKAGITPPPQLSPILLSIGEPKQPTPAFIGEQLLSHVQGLARYPTTRGSSELRQAIADWCCHRFRLADGALDPARQLLPVNGTREALFAFAQAVVDPSRQPLVLMPNPFYQIYEGAALLAGAEPHFLPCRAEQGFIADFAAVDTATWERCQLLYICSPGNPTGAVIDNDQLQRLITLALRHDFIIAADECYSEIYYDEANPPPGLLQAAVEMGNSDFRNCVVFHSLSKRSNAPGLRSGFVAGDKRIIEPFFNYRTYQGCAMSLPVQAASTAAWRDEQHVCDNRAQYREKFDAVLDILYDVLDIAQPQAGFYLWPETPIPDDEFARRLFQQQNVTLLPGSYLSRQVADWNPGDHRVRIALVAPLSECIDAAVRIKQFIKSL